MPRAKNIIPPTSLHITVPQDIRAWMDLHLFSEVEQCVPRGSYQKLIVQLLREYRSKLETPRDSVS